VVESQTKPWLRFLPWVALGLLVLASIVVWFPDGKRFHLLGPHPMACLAVLAYLVVEVFLARPSLPVTPVVLLPRESGRAA
jgi:hypothetical protein